MTCVSIDVETGFRPHFKEKNPNGSVNSLTSFFFERKDNPLSCTSVDAHMHKLQSPCDVPMWILGPTVLPNE